MCRTYGLEEAQDGCKKFEVKVGLPCRISRPNGQVLQNICSIACCSCDHVKVGRLLCPCGSQDLIEFDLQGVVGLLAVTILPKVVVPIETDH